MAARAHREGATTVLGAAMSKHYWSEVFGNRVLLMSVPTDEIPDNHLVLEVHKGATWGSFHAPITTRMYLNHDLENSALTFMRPLHEYLFREENRADLLAVGGLQMLNQRDIKRSGELLTEMASDFARLQRIGTRVHIELATFSDELLWNEVALVLATADSIGLNDQELDTFLTFGG